MDNKRKHVNEAFEKLAEGMIKALEKRNMVGHYFASKEELCEFLKNDIPKGASVTWGGSESLKESGATELLLNGDYEFINRDGGSTPKEARELYARQAMADYFFMSTNAITMDGELVNVDGRGNRVALLIWGPEHVYVIAGRNKVVPTLEDAHRRARNIAAPPNCMRLGLKTPCSVTGRCGDCLGDSTICCQIVTTRASRTPGRIHILLVNEELGF